MTTTTETPVTTTLEETTSVEATTSPSTSNAAGVTTSVSGGPGGVLSGPTKVARAAGKPTLPFTGLPLWPFALGAIGLTLLGLGLRRLAASPRS